MAPILSYRPLDSDKAAAVATDSLPRVARYIEHFDDAGVESFGAEVLHVLYLADDSGLPRSVLASEWQGDLPADPTPAESAAAIAARETRRDEARERRRWRIHLAESAVGIHVKDLTLPQRTALVELLLLRAGALDDDLAVRPLETWIS